MEKVEKILQTIEEVKNEVIKLLAKNDKKLNDVKTKLFYYYDCGCYEYNLPTNKALDRLKNLDWACVAVDTELTLKGCLMLSILKNSKPGNYETFKGYSLTYYK